MSKLQRFDGLSNFFKTFRPFVARHYKLILVGMFGLLSSTVLRVLEPWPLKFVIDRITEQGYDRARINIDAVAALDTQTLLLTAAIALIAVAALRAGASYIGTIGFALAGNRTLTDVRAALFQHLQNLSLRFHGNAKGGDLVVRMIGDIGMVQEVAVTAVLPLFGNLLVLTGMLAIMFWLDPVLAGIAVCTLPVLMIATWRRGGRIREAAKRTRHQESALAATTAESFTAIKTVQTLSLGGRFAGNFSRQNNASQSEGVKVKRLSASLERGVDVIIATATAVVLWVGATRVIDGNLSPGELLVFLFYLKGAFRPLRDFAKYGSRLAKASAAADRIVELFNTRIEVEERPDALDVPTLKGQITYQDVDFAYEKGVQVLRGIDLTLEPGTHTAIVGASGSGKSTLASLLLRLYDPTAGRLTIDGLDLRDMKVDALRTHVSTVLQDSSLFAGTVRDNIALGVHSEVSDEAVEHAARIANAHDFIMQLDKGYDTPLGERGTNLSAGQRQRIAIARAAMRNSPILILDEPTTGLDRQNEFIVHDALMKLSSGRTTLHITHRPEAATCADRVIVLREGQIVEDGTPEELTTAGTAFAAMLGTGDAAATEYRHAIR